MVPCLFFLDWSVILNVMDDLRGPSGRPSPLDAVQGRNKKNNRGSCGFCGWRKGCGDLKVLGETLRHRNQRHKKRNEQ